MGNIDNIVAAVFQYKHPVFPKSFDEMNCIDERKYKIMHAANFDFSVDSSQGSSSEFVLFQCNPLFVVLIFFSLQCLHITYMNRASLLYYAHTTSFYSFLQSIIF